MKIFITGGAGFIGSHMVDALMSEGNQIKVFDNLSSGKIGFIEHHFGSHQFNLIKADLLDLKILKKEMSGYEMVFHFAANPDARLGIEDTSLDLYQETIVTYNILESMRVNKIKKLVFSSSGTIYGETPVIPLHEDYGPVQPISLYGAGKVASEALICAFCNTFDMQSWIFRFANIIGGRATHGVIFDFINKLKKNSTEMDIFGDGSQEKPYLHIRECINGILFGIKKTNSKVNVLNLGCASSTDVKTIAKIVVEEMGLENVKFMYRGGDRGWPGDVPQVRFDIRKMENLGWKSTQESEEAVRKATKEILKEQDWECRQ